ncbi:MAG: hypothetical protein HKN29_13605 [Rhodothermales bacterium]|nr:hypothetical protein [Rhodothermales bacterium]
MSRLLVVIESIASIFDLSGTYFPSRFGRMPNDREAIQNDFRVTFGDLHAGMMEADQKLSESQGELFGAE